MDTLDALRLFLGIAETGSLSAAARRHSVATSTISSALQQLERQAGATLVRRSTRRLSFTHEGLRFLADAKKLLADWDASVSGITEGPLRGPIKVTSTVNLGRSRIVPAVDRFMEIHPGISIDLHISDSVVDIVDQNIDVAIRNGPLRDSSLKARLILRGHRVVCASPSYWRTFGRPEHPQDLVGHSCLVVSRPGTTFSTWHFVEDGKAIPVRVSGNRIVNDGSILKNWALKGYGVFLCPMWDVREELAAGDLETALDDYLPDNANLYAVTDSGAVSRRVQTLIDFLVEDLQR